MMRSAPSISTTGMAGVLSRWKYGTTSAARAAASTSERSWSRTLANTSMEVGI